MNIDIVIPTLNRVEKLTNCLNSVFMSARNTPVNIYIYFSVVAELEYFKKYFQYVDEVHLCMVEDYRVPNFWNSHLRTMTADAMLYANDDILFFPETLQLIVEKFRDEIGNYDAVLGLSQSNLPEGQALEGAFGVIGRQFADRFTNRQVWCPEYYRFRGDFELMHFAKSIGLFYFDPNIKIEHLHPAFHKELHDETHDEVRKFLGTDNAIFRMRQSQGLLWGKNFTLIKESNDTI